MRRTKKNVITVAAASALFLSACGGGDAQGSDDGEVLNVGQISDSIAFFPLYIAEENGYFEDEGITLGERPRLGTGARLAAALNSGSIDIAAGVATDAFNLAETDPGTVVTGALVTEYYVDVVVAEDFAESDPEASLEDKIRALEGQTIGITGPGSGTEALLIYLFDLVGLDANQDATLVNLDASPSSAIGALESGQIDAFSFFQPAGQIAESSGVGEIFISPQRGDIPDMEGQFHGALFSTEEVLEGRGEQVSSFNAAVDSALSFIEENPDEAAEMLGQYLDGADEGTLDALAEILPQQMAPSTAVSQESYEPALDFHLTSGLIDEEIAYEDVVWDEVRD